MGLKEYIKKKVASAKVDLQDSLAYKKKLNQAVKEARRGAYLKEAVKQSQASARRTAQMRFNPPKVAQNKSLFPQVVIPQVSFGGPTPQPTQMRSVVKRKLRKGKSRKKRRTYQREMTPVAKPKRDSFNDLMWKY